MSPSRLELYMQSNVAVMRKNLTGYQQFARDSVFVYSIEWTVRYLTRS